MGREVVRRGFHQVRGDRQHFVAHGDGGLARRATGDDRGAAPARAGAVGRRLRIGLHDGDVLVGDAEVVGDDLGHGRLDALTV